MQDRWRNLEVWRLADDLAFRIYGLTKGFPRDERYAITSQLRRAALSVPTNIVEGYSRKGDRQLAHFLDIGYGSLSEVKYLLGFSNRLGYLSGDEYASAMSECETVGRLLWAFYDKVKGTDC